jgi:hypothetical protein
LDKDLESCLHRVSFVLPLYFHAIVLVLIDCSILEELALSGKQCARRADELAQVVKNAELDVLVKSQAEKISELETAYADLKHEKDNVTTGYQRLAAKHDAIKEKVEREKQSLRRPTRQRLQSFMEICIWRRTATQNTTRLCAAGPASFTR